MKKYWNIAHRGFKSKDNSKVAILNAIKSNFDVIEIDIHYTLDKRIILQHDLFLNDYHVEKTPLHVLQEIDSDLLTIEDFFEIIKSLQTNKKVEILIDMKGDLPIAQLLMDFLETNVEKKYLNQILIASFQIRHLHVIFNSHFKVAGIGFNTCSDFVPPEIIPYIEFVSIDIHILSPQIITYLREKNLVIFVFTCKLEQQFQIINQYDVDGIISDILIL